MTSASVLLPGIPRVPVAALAYPRALDVRAWATTRETAKGRPYVAAGPVAFVVLAIGTGTATIEVASGDRTQIPMAALLLQSLPAGPGEDATCLTVRADQLRRQRAARG